LSCHNTKQAVTDSATVSTTSLSQLAKDTLKKTHISNRHDSIVTADSVDVRETLTLVVSEKGDTVWRDRIVYKDRIRTITKAAKQQQRDTIYKVKIDTIRLERTDSIYIYKENEALFAENINLTADLQEAQLKNKAVSKKLWAYRIAALAIVALLLLYVYKKIKK